MKRILFLCHGNICRSPMAEFILKDKVNKLNLADKYEINSKALTNDEIGNDIYPDAKRCLDRHNIKYEKRAASRFNLEDYDYYDDIYVMDKSNLYLISKLTNDPLKKIKLLNGYIEDPWYTDNFDKVFDLIEKGIDNIIKHN